MQVGVLILRASAALAALVACAGAAVADDKLACGNSVRSDSIGICTRLLQGPSLTSAERFMALYNRGWAHRRAGNFDLAIADFDAAQAEAPTFAKLYLSRALSHQDMGRCERALSDARTYTEMAPADPQGWKLRSICQRELGNMGEALGDIKKAIEISPFSSEFQTLHVLTLIEAGRIGEAETRLKALLDIDPSEATLHYVKARLHFRTGDMAAAETHAAKAIEVKPLFSAAHALMGQIAESSGALSDARRSYALARKPGVPLLEMRSAQRLASARLAELDGRPAAGRSKDVAAASGPKTQPTMDCRRYIAAAGITISEPCR